MFKKGQGLPVRVLIIIIICLIVLAVVIFFFRTAMVEIFANIGSKIKMAFGLWNESAITP